MKLATFALVLAAAFLMRSPQAQAQQGPACSFMLDVSQSMEGYSLVAGHPLLQVIDKLRARCPDTRVFGNTLRPIPPGPIRFRDGLTRIGPLLKEWSAGAPDAAFLILLTDNISDEAVSITDPTAEFYAALRDDNSVFSQVTVMGLRADFEGKLYDPGNHHRPSVPYHGPRALTLYLLGKGTANDMAGYRALRGDLQSLLAATGHHESSSGDDDSAFAVFDVKPFAIETFRVASNAASVQTESEDAGDQGRCSSDARFDAQTGTFLIVGQPMDQDCTIKANLRVRFAARWCLVDAGLTAAMSIRADDPDVLKQAVQALPVSPSRATLCAEEKKLLVGLNFSAFRFADNVGFFDRLARTFTGSFTAQGELVVMGSVRRENVHLEGGLAQAWSYGSDDNIDVAMSPSPGIQRKVFRLEEGVRAVIPGEQLNGYRLIRYPVKIEVRYDQSPLFVLLFFVLLGIAVLGAIVWLAIRPSAFIIESEAGQETRTSLGFLGQAGASAGGIDMKLINCALFLLTTANGRIVRGRILGPSGGVVEIHASGSPAPRHSLWARKTRPGDGEDDFDSYDHAIEATDASAAPGHEPVTFTVRSVPRGRAGLPEGGNDDGF